MSVKDQDRRLAFWISFVFIASAPYQVVFFGMDAEAVKASAYALTTLGVANYFSKPTGEL